MKNGPATVKFAQNCEFRLFQRPDDAIQRGLAKQTEANLALGGVLLSNYEPLKRDEILAMTRRVADFDQFSEPMQRVLGGATESKDEYAVCSANPRLVNGTPTKNPGYLQRRRIWRGPSTVTWPRWVCGSSTRFRSTCPSTLS